MAATVLRLRCIVGCFHCVVFPVNSFDQFGVELGKKLADQVRKQMVASRAEKGKAKIDAQFNPSTAALLNRYFTAKGVVACFSRWDSRSGRHQCCGEL